MKFHKVLLLFNLLFLTTASYSQNFNSEKIAWVKYVERMYKSSPFEGVKVLMNIDNSVLLSVLTLEPKKYDYKQSVIYRVATVKAQEQASRYFNGSKIHSSDIIINRKDFNDGDSIAIINTIISNSTGYVKGLELVNSFTNDSVNTVFIFASEIK